MCGVGGWEQLNIDDRWQVARLFEGAVAEFADDWFDVVPQSVQDHIMGLYDVMDAECAKL
ncbi:hypothetical protein [Corynebacterium lizhenjunii]|uniref:hypothetical protein n=1 Tax=Corynebacterium lizhenjunii TaxID=2709394 RepID=UPI0013EB8F29|nr:hypothetical protein [Corynebacterium lizhenjunii]